MVTFMCGHGCSTGPRVRDDHRSTVAIWRDSPPCPNRPTETVQPRLGSVDRAKATTETSRVVDVPPRRDPRASISARWFIRRVGRDPVTDRRRWTPGSDVCYRGLPRSATLVSTVAAAQSKFTVQAKAVTVAVALPPLNSPSGAVTEAVQVIG